MTAAAAPASAPDAATRQRRLSESIARLRTRATGRDPERWLLFVGGALLPLGLLVILLGWIGASNTPRLFEQIPYMISGGLLGLGLVFAGGFTYFAYWVTRLIKEQRDQNASLLAAMEAMERRLAVFEGGALEGSDSRANGARTTTAGVAPTFVATSTGSMYHRPDCPVVAGKTGVRSVDPDAGDFKPCRICEPHLLDA